MTTQLLRVTLVVTALLLATTLARADEPLAPWLRLDGKVGTDRNLGRANLFAPIYDDGRGMLYLDIRGVLTDASTEEGNVGIGYRRLVDDRYILGAYGFVDVKSTAYDNTILQATVGAEAISRHFELRLNGYIPDSDKKLIGSAGVDSSTAVLQVSQTNVSLTADHNRLYEQAMWGVDVEVGYTYYLRDLEFHDALDDLDLRVLAGWYHFENDGPDVASGPMGRVEMNWRDPMGLDGWQFTVGAEGRSDDIRGDDGYLTAALQIPLGRLWGRDDRPAAGSLRDRMHMPVRRDVDIVTSTFVESSTETTPVYNQFGGMLTGGYYFTADGTGDGSFDNPGALDDALALGENTLAVGVKRTGGDVDEFATVTMMNGQVLAGADTLITLQVPTTGGFADVSFYPVPGGSAAEAAPALIATGGADEYILLANDNHINGLTIDGSAADVAIFGDGITNGLFTNNPATFISGDDAAILLDEAMGSFVVYNTRFVADGDDETGIYVTGNPSGSLSVTDSSFVLMNDAEGLYFEDSVGDTSTFTLSISGSTFTGDGSGQGIEGYLDDRSSFTAYVLDSTFTSLERGITFELEEVNLSLYVQRSTFMTIEEESIEIDSSESSSSDTRLMVSIANNSFKLPIMDEVVDIFFVGGSADISVASNIFDLNDKEIAAIVVGLEDLDTASTSTISITDNVISNGAGSDEADDEHDNIFVGLFGTGNVDVSILRNTVSDGRQSVHVEVEDDMVASVTLANNTFSSGSSTTGFDDAIDFDLEDDAVVTVMSSGNTVTVGGTNNESALDIELEDDSSIVYKSTGDTFSAATDSTVDIYLETAGTASFSFTNLTLSGGQTDRDDGIRIEIESSGGTSLSLTSSTLTGMSGLTDNDGVDLEGTSFTTVTIRGVTISGWEDGIDIDDATITTKNDLENDNTFSDIDEENVDE